MSTSVEEMRSELSAAVTGSGPGLAGADELYAACVHLFGVDGAAVSIVLEGSSRGTFGSSNELSRRLDGYQFTYGEGPCLDSVSTRGPVLVNDLDSPDESRWPAFSGAVLGDGVRGVFALPIMTTSACVGALDLFRKDPGPLGSDQLSGAVLAAELASLPLLRLLTSDIIGSESTLDDKLMAEGEDAWGLLADMDRIEVYQATGMLISQLDVDAPEALVRLHAHAMATDQTASQVASAIVERRLILDRDDRSDMGRNQS